HYGGNDAASVLRRYNPDGILDTAFGDVAVAGWGAVGVAALALQQDGKVLAAGSVYDPAGYGGWIVSRFNPDGSPDTTFGQGGKATVNFAAAGSNRAYSMAVQPDGRILVAGSAGWQFAAARLLPTGTL